MRLGQLAGMARSLLMYYAVPGRQRAMRRLYGQFLQPGDVGFDIGAHAGSRLRVWRGLGAAVVAVEPQPAFFRLLQWLYGRSADITLLPVAIGDQPGEATMYISSRTPTVTTLSQEWMTAVQEDPSFAGVDWDTVVTIPVTTLDELIAEYGRPAFCKIDVEGYEPVVLAGLSQPIAALSFEYIPAAMAGTLACIARLGELGDYRYNWSPGERHQLQAASWLDAGEITAVLQALTPADGSGDVYARYVED